MTQGMDGNRRMSMNHILNIRDSLVEEFKHRRQMQSRQSSTPTSSKLDNKKFKEDEMLPKQIITPTKIEVSKPLPTLKSLANENTKLQRLLNISLA